MDLLQARFINEGGCERSCWKNCCLHWGSRRSCRISTRAAEEALPSGATRSAFRAGFIERHKLPLLKFSASSPTYHASRGTLRSAVELFQHFAGFRSSELCPGLTGRTDAQRSVRWLDLMVVCKLWNLINSLSFCTAVHVPTTFAAVLACTVHRRLKLWCPPWHCTA